MGKGIIFSESIPEQRSEHLVVLQHAVFFCFDVDKFTPITEHKAFMDKTLVPFIGRAVKRLGPGTYNLIIHGSASATGSSEHNFELGAQRAGNIAREIIAKFESEKKKDASLANCTLEPEIINHGDEDAEEDPLLKGARKGGRARVEKVQAIFRSAVFNFRAKQPNKSAVFHIREVYFFNFKKIEEPLPKVLKDIEDFLEKPIQKFIAKQILDKLLGPVKTALSEISPLGGALIHFVTFMIPSTVDYCFEIKDSLKAHALYRFNGVEHKDSLGLLDLIGFVTKLLGVIKALEAAAKAAAKGSALAKKLFDLAEKLAKTTDELVDKIAAFLEPVLGAETTAALKQLFIEIRDGIRPFFESLAVPGSPFTPFRYHDNSADHDVATLAGPARRIAVDVAFNSSVEIFFGGSASSRSTAFMAQAHIITGFGIRNSLFGIGTAEGLFILLRKDYLADIQPGLFTPVTA